MVSFLAKFLIFRFWPKIWSMVSFLGVENKFREKYATLKGMKREIEWNLFQLHSTFE